METTNYGHLSQSLKTALTIVCAGSTPTCCDWIIPQTNRLERIVSALESIGVNLDETDIEALEVLAGNGRHEYGMMREDLAEAINNSIGEVQEESREREQEQAIEALAVAGFVLDDEDGETWTRDDVTVKIEYVHPAESTYRWEYHKWDSIHGGPGFNKQFTIGKSGDFHRLMALIGKTEVKQ